MSRWIFNALHLCVTCNTIDDKRKHFTASEIVSERNTLGGFSEISSQRYFQRFCIMFNVLIILLICSTLFVKWSLISLFILRKFWKSCFWARLILIMSRISHSLSIETMQKYQIVWYDLPRKVQRFVAVNAFCYLQFQSHHKRKTIHLSPIDKGTNTTPFSKSFAQIVLSTRTTTIHSHIIH